MKPGGKGGAGKGGGGTGIDSDCCDKLKKSLVKSFGSGGKPEGRFFEVVIVLSSLCIIGCTLSSVCRLP